jgi:hypothetical protein
MAQVTSDKSWQAEARSGPNSQATFVIFAVITGRAPASVPGCLAAAGVTGAPISKGSRKADV